MRILNLHGLNGSNINTNYNFLKEYYHDREDVEILSPQIDYANIDPRNVILDLLKEYDNIDIVVGNSFGGFYAYIFGAITDSKTLLLNPCIPPHEYIQTLEPSYKYTQDLKTIWEIYQERNMHYSVIFGNADEVLDIQTTLNNLKPEVSDVTIIPGGHRLRGELYEAWFKEQLKDENLQSKS